MAGHQPAQGKSDILVTATAFLPPGVQAANVLAVDVNFGGWLHSGE